MDNKNIFSIRKAIKLILFLIFLQSIGGILFNIINNVFFY